MYQAQLVVEDQVLLHHPDVVLGSQVPVRWIVWHTGLEPLQLQGLIGDPELKHVVEHCVLVRVLLVRALGKRLAADHSEESTLMLVIVLESCRELLWLLGNASLNLAEVLQLLL